jgi:hypothetical protein
MSASCGLGGNLGARGQRVRMRGAVLTIAASITLMAALLGADLARGYRAALFLPFFFAANLFFQSLYRT